MLPITAGFMQSGGMQELFMLAFYLPISGGGIQSARSCEACFG